MLFYTETLWKWEADSKHCNSREFMCLYYVVSGSLHRFQIYSVMPAKVERGSGALTHFTMIWKYQTGPVLVAPDWDALNHQVKPPLPTSLTRVSPASRTTHERTCTLWKRQSSKESKSELFITSYKYCSPNVSRSRFNRFRQYTNVYIYLFYFYTF